MSQALNPIIIGIAFISIGLFQYGKSIVKIVVRKDPVFGLYECEVHPDKYLGMEYPFIMMILSFIATIFCVWSVIIIMSSIWG